MIFSSIFVALLLFTSTALSQNAGPPVGNGTDSCDGRCLNGGTCTRAGGGQVCQCPAGFSGSTCEINEGQSDHPGTCPVVKPDSLSVCGGTFCEKDNECETTEKCCLAACGSHQCTRIQNNVCEGHCLNGGKCLVVEGAPVCHCLYGFSGSRCESSAADSHPGTCPNVESGGASVCGGDFCRNDSQCNNSQKCCDSLCGGKLCTAVNAAPAPGPFVCNMNCMIGAVCRPVVSCSTCQLEPKCTHSESIQKDADSDCQQQNYAQAVLIEDPNNSSLYNTLGCDRACPADSTCVYDRAGRGTCCRGRADVVTPTEKPGTCPKGDFFICGGKMCTVDSDCPGAQKCCPGCGNLCTEPVTEELCGNNKCPAGYICQHKQRYCPPGSWCIQALVPTCVPIGCAKCEYNEFCLKTNYGYDCLSSDPCGGICPDNHVCYDTGIRCITTPCPSYECVTVDECGGCPKGKVCTRNDTASYNCVDKNDQECPLKCGSGYSCQLQSQECSKNRWKMCSSKLTPACVNIKPELGNCPRLTLQQHFSTLCRLEKLFIQRCKSDKDCKNNSKCCPSACGNKRCKPVKKRTLGDSFFY